MRKKFYTRFLLRSGDEGFADEYSGVVEVSAPANQVLDPIEIEQLLAKNSCKTPGQREEETLSH